MEAAQMSRFTVIEVESSKIWTACSTLAEAIAAAQAIKRDLERDCMIEQTQWVWSTMDLKHAVRIKEG
jgi:hypothetical protein